MSGGMVALRATDASEQAIIWRVLSGENGLGGDDERDPVLSVEFNFGPSPLHPGDPAPYIELIQHLRASDLHRLVDALVEAREAAVQARMIPGPLSDAEWWARRETVKAIADVTGSDSAPATASEADEPPEPADRDEEDDGGYDAGDRWRKGTIYDHRRRRGGADETGG